MKEIELMIDTEEIADFFYLELTRRGYIPNEDELFEIADITVDYLIAKCMIDEHIED